MRAGRELDRLVAEAMGQTDFGHPRFSWSEVPLEDGDGWDGWICPRCWTSEKDKENPCIKMYSTDIRKAMEAWEWLEQNNPWGQIAFSRSKGQPCVLQLSPPFTRNFPNSWDVEEITVGESYPHAIALAVIKASEVKK